MTLQQLQYIVALDTHRHFVKAAESCYVAQPTLTLQVKKLESEIGMALFDRSIQPLKPTPMGEAFIQKARQILRDIDQLKAMVNDERETMAGTFRVAVIPSLSQYLLPLFLHEFATKYPDSKLEILEMQSEDIIDALKHDTLDIGILSTPLNEPGVREIPIFYEPILLYANQHCALLNATHINANNIREKGLWLLNKGHCFREQMRNICKRSEVLSGGHNITFEGGSIETLKKMVKNSHGYTMIPELAFDAERDEPFTRRFMAPEPAREVSLVVHHSFTKEMLLTNLRKSILARLPKAFRTNNRFVTVKWR